ncbi:MAG: glycosyltransferase family 2 protein [Calditrichia bacterium]
MLDVSFIIVNYNSSALVVDLLESFEKHCYGFSYEVIIVDNASHPDQLELLRESLNGDKHMVISSEENLGFGGANNKAVEKASGKYLALINPDTLLTENSIDKVLQLRRELSDHRAIIGVKLVNADGSWQISKQTYPRITDTLMQAFFLDSLFKKSPVFDRQYYRWQDEDACSQVESIRGAFMFMETALFNELEGFDEDFFIYTEETDLCYRASQAGVKIYHFPKTSIIHLEGQSMNLNRLKTWIELYKTKILFARKHYGFLNALGLRVALGFSALNRGVLNTAMGVFLLRQPSWEKAKVYFLSTLWLLGIPITNLSPKNSHFSKRP